MIKQFFQSRQATKMDVILAAGAAVMAVAHFFDVKKQYNDQQEEESE